MPTVRRPAVAGTFYPGTERALSDTLDALLTTAGQRGEPGPSSKNAKILVAPHAGYVYSGPIAASTFAALKQRSEVRRVVLLGPAHRVYFRGVALPGVDAYASPLGSVPIDRDAVSLLREMSDVIVSPEAHAEEHSLEVELPFLQATLPHAFTLVPLLCGDISPDRVAAIIDRLFGGPETLIVVSSDLSHYLPYATAQATDAATAKSVLALEPALSHEQACGATPLNAALQVARERGLHATLLDLRNSGDTAGDKRRVVGYAGFAIGS